MVLPPSLMVTFVFMPGSPLKKATTFFLQERQSLIAGAGLGCFVTEDVKAGQFLEEYTGEIVAR